MGFLSKKQEVNIKEFCVDFYEKNILSPVIEGYDAGAAYDKVVIKNVSEADSRFAKVNTIKFAKEIKILRFELFALAWLHKFGEKLAVKQSDFTKDYLQKRKFNYIWSDAESYNQALGQSATLGNTLSTRSGRMYLTMRNSVMLDFFKNFTKAGYDPKAVARVANRTFNDVAWKEGIAPAALMLNLCRRLGFKVSGFESGDNLNKEAQICLVAVIRGFYDGVRQSLDQIKVLD